MNYYAYLFFITFSFCGFLFGVEKLEIEVVRSFPHDVTAFTQGLAIHNDQIYESTGLYGFSSLKRLRERDGKTIQSEALPPTFFGEGLAVFDDCIIQLTWKEKTAIIYDRLSFSPIGHFTYKGEGWGLCRDQDTVWMSDGSDVIVQRNAHSFTPLKSIKVTWDDQPVLNINDLECMNNNLYANVWGKNYLLRIDKETGQVTAIIDASKLLSAQEHKLLTSLDDVLNGIAYRSSTDTFFLTGKRWPKMFEVRFAK